MQGGGLGWEWEMKKWPFKGSELGVESRWSYTRPREWEYFPLANRHKMSTRTSTVINMLQSTIRYQKSTVVLLSTRLRTPGVECKLENSYIIFWNAVTWWEWVVIIWNYYMLRKTYLINLQGLRELCVTQKPVYFTLVNGSPHWPEYNGKSSAVCTLRTY
jgi:hypothetical protein